MAYDWHSPSATEAFHPRLEPISAWFFARKSAFLRSGDAASLYAMGIDARGFNPGVPDAWRALSMPNPVKQTDLEGHPFGVEALTSELGAQVHAIPDPRVYVLPLTANDARPADILLTNRGLGTPRTQTPQIPMRPPKAIIGIIDHGINIFHHRFRRGQTDSRIAYAWMQGEPRGAEDRIRFGREWTQPEIETVQAEAGVDEDALLRQLGVDFSRPGFQPLGFRSSHGTHVLDLAAGLDPQDDRTQDFPIITVTLPAEVTRETTGSMLGVPFAMGLEYIADRARWVMRQHDTIAPVFVNFSFGLSGGPRKGLHRLEQTIDRIAAYHTEQVNELIGPGEAPFVVVTAAGNNNLARGHAKAPPGTDRLDLRWQIQPGDPSANILELRFEPSASGAQMFALSLTPPGEDMPQRVQLVVTEGRTLETIRLLRRHGVPIGQLSAWEIRGGVIVLTLALAPTDPGNSVLPVAPSGEWQVSLDCETTPQRIDAWILRDDVPGGFRDTGRQSYFVDPDYQARDERGFVLGDDDSGKEHGVMRAGTLNALATGERDTDPQMPQDATCWVVGGSVGSDPAPYSATPLSSAETVDLSAPSDHSRVIGGVVAAGTRSGSAVALSGTSVAVPQVLRHFAIGDGVLEPVDETPRLGRHLLRNRSSTQLR